jgi:hypothetical protein
MENALLKIITNVNFSKTKNKWEIIGKLTEVYLHTIYLLQLETSAEPLGNTEHRRVISEDEIKAQQKYCSEVLELIKILVNSPSSNDIVE